MNKMSCATLRSEPYFMEKVALNNKGYQLLIDRYTIITTFLFKQPKTCYTDTNRIYYSPFVTAKQ